MISKEIDQIYARIGRVALGDDLQVLAPTLYSLTVTASVKDLHSAAAPLLIALSAASIGLNAEESRTGFIPLFLSNRAQTAAQGILHRNKNPSQVNLLSHILEQLFANVILVTDAVVEREDLLNYELYLRMLIKTGLLEKTAEMVLKNCGLLEKHCAILAQALALTLTLLSLRTVAWSHNKEALEIIESFSPILSKWIENVSQFIIDEVRQESIQSQAASETSYLLQQLLLGLEQKNYPFFLTTLEAFEPNFNSSMEKFRAVQRNLVNSLILGHEDINTTTGVVQG